MGGLGGHITGKTRGGLTLSSYNKDIINKCNISNRKAGKRAAK